jgi:hypothetical protein
VPGFISGPHKGSSGMVNVLNPGTDVKTVSVQPGFATLGAIDRLERTERIQAGISPEFGGESGTNIRTGRRGDAVMSAVVDPQVQEAQEIFQESLGAENRIACATAKAYFGGIAKTFYVGWKGAKGHVDYVPASVFETDHNLVAYAATGTDVNNLTIETGQLVSTGLMSTETARKIHPHIDDPDLEGDLVIREQLIRATLASLEQQATSGAIPPGDMARIAQLVVVDNMEPFDAILQVQKEAQERQATPMPQGDPATQPGLRCRGGRGVRDDAGTVGRVVERLVGPGDAPLDERGWRSCRVKAPAGHGRARSAAVSEPLGPAEAEAVRGAAVRHRHRTGPVDAGRARHRPRPGACGHHRRSQRPPARVDGRVQPPDRDRQPCHPRPAVRSRRRSRSPVVGAGQRPGAVEGHLPPAPDA